MTKKLNNTFLAGSSGTDQNQQPTPVSLEFWIKWALEKWVEDDKANICDSYRMFSQNAKQNIINELLGSIGSQTLLPFVVDFVMQGTPNKESTGIALFGVALMLFAEADDTTLQSCGIVNGTDLKTTIAYCKKMGQQDLISFLTNCEPRVLIPFLQRVIREAGKIRDAQCGPSVSGPTPS